MPLNVSGCCVDNGYIFSAMNEQVLKKYWLFQD